MVDHNMIYQSLDLLERRAGQRLILPDGMPYIYVHGSRGQMFLCMAGERLSEQFPGQPLSVDARARQMFALRNIIHSDSAEVSTVDLCSSTFFDICLWRANIQCPLWTTRLHAHDGYLTCPVSERWLSPSVSMCKSRIFVNINPTAQGGNSWLRLMGNEQLKEEKRQTAGVTQIFLFKSETSPKSSFLEQVKSKCFKSFLTSSQVASNLGTQWPMFQGFSVDIWKTDDRYSIWTN